MAEQVKKLQACQVGKPVSSSAASGGSGGEGENTHPELRWWWHGGLEIRSRMKIRNRSSKVMTVGDGAAPSQINAGIVYQRARGLGTLFVTR